MKVIAVSPLLTAVGGIADWSPGIYVGVPFMIGIAPANGRLNSFTTKDPAQLGSNVIHYTNAVTQATISVGSTIPSTNWGTSYQLASEVTFVTNLEPTNYDGLEMEAQIAMPEQHDWEYHLLDETVQSIKESRPISGNKPDEPLLAYRLTENNFGLHIEPLEPGTKSHRHFSNHLEEIETGLVSAKIYAAIEPDQVFVAVKSNNLTGVLVGEVEASSNAENRFRLAVTATHQYKSRLVNIVNEFRGVEPLVGKTRLIIGGNVAYGYPESDTNISQVSYSVTPLMLATGDNDCRIEYLYPDGSIEYMPFKIFKEDSKRITVERTFRDYDGGYDGIRLNPSVAGFPDKYPCFMVPEGSGSSLIKTTDYTSIPLSKYTGLQGVQIDAAGVKVLTSFDKGLTWKSLVADVWQTVSIDNIDSAGMTEDLINSTVFARWAEIFKPTSLDFAILLDNLSSQYAIAANEQLLFSSLAYGSTIYPVPAGMAATKVEYAISGYNSPSYTFVASYTEYLNDVVIYSRATGAYPGPSGYSGTRAFDGYNVNRPNKFSTSYGGWYDYKQSLKVYGSPLVSYVKSINAQITPSLRTGYAFIM
jgi:hypothetical protein